MTLPRLEAPPLVQELTLTPVSWNARSHAKHSTNMVQVRARIHIMPSGSCVLAELAREVTICSMASVGRGAISCSCGLTVFNQITLL